jgi:cytochrome c-type biogenesis protein CcmH/NrfG
MNAVARIAQDRQAAQALARRFARVVRMRAEDAHAWHALGSALVRVGDPSGACWAFRNALRLDHNHIHSHRALGNLLFDCGQFDQALRCFALCESGA